MDFGYQREDGRMNDIQRFLDMVTSVGFWVGLLLGAIIASVFRVPTLGQRCASLGYEFDSVECYREVREPNSDIWQFVDETVE